MRSLSAQILIAFLLVVATYAISTTMVVSYMDDVDQEIGVIRTGYLPLALQAKNLARRQEDLRGYLADDFPSEPSLRYAQRNLLRYRRARDKTLEQVAQTLQKLGSVPERHRKKIAETERRLLAIKTTIGELTSAYSVLTQAIGNGASAAVALSASENSALSRLTLQEAALASLCNEWADFQQQRVTLTALNLEHNEKRLRQLTLSMGVVAVLLGLLMGWWTRVALRPLRRLHDAANKVAAGDYGTRLAESGPREVADLAREFNRMSQAIQDRERQVVRAERLAAVGKMAAMITHEVRNPLASIGLNVELLEEELQTLAANQEARSLCRAITKEVDRLAAITEEYLGLTRLPAPKLTREDVAGLLGDLVDFLRDDLRAKGVALRVEAAPTPVYASLDARQIRQCLLNLVRNAAEAMLHGGSVTCRVTSDMTHVQIDVDDTGPGVPEEHLPRLFDPFYTTKPGGTGLGLALTLEIAHQHGGELLVSNQAAGARFSLRLPRTPT